uniref:Uncharacterized protein n=1 Tax=Trypanosoma congolense (strain IL3000) TaxID=1068625 RepID=G0URL8_TRYCI|nr:hypothetical protein, unlikely [Trypanosoma congolense IL3000]
MVTYLLSPFHSIPPATMKKKRSHTFVSRIPSAQRTHKRTQARVCRSQQKPFSLRVSLRDYTFPFLCFFSLSPTPFSPSFVLRLVATLLVTEKQNKTKLVIENNKETPFQPLPTGRVT